METKKIRQLGFFSALTICVGSVVGIGIFFKNASIQGFNNNDGISWLLSWVFGGLIALLVAIHFGKLSKVKLSNDDAGLSGWANHYTTEKQKWFSKLVSINYSLFYNSILYVILVFLTGESIIEFIFNAQGKSHEDFPVWIVAIISIALGILIYITNFFSHKFVGIASQITTIIKFIPLVIVIMSGIILFNEHNFIDNNNVVKPGENAFNNSNSPLESFQGILMSLPAVLFAFDNFVGVGVMGNRFKGGEKTISRVIFFGMIAVIIIYILVAVSSILHAVNPSFLGNVIKDIFSEKTSRVLNVFLSLVIFISVFGTTIAVGAVCIKEFENIVNKNIIFKNEWFVNKFGTKKTTLFLSVFVLVFWTILMYVPASIMNSDQIIDGFSNFPIVLFFLVYIFLIFFFWKNEYILQEKRKIRKRIYSTFVWFTIFAISIVISVNIILSIKEAIEKPFNIGSWGLYFNNGMGINNLSGIIFYLLFIILFFSTPFINSALIKKSLKKTQLK